MTAKDFMKKLFEKSVIDAYRFYLSSGEKPEIFRNVYDTAEEMFERFERDPNNTCTSAWREGYLVEVIVHQDGEIAYTCGISMQEIANQPTWFTDTVGDDLVAGYLDGLFAAIQELAFQIKRKVRSHGGYDLWLALTDTNDDQSEYYAITQKGEVPSSWEGDYNETGLLVIWNNLTGDNLEPGDMGDWYK